MSQSLLLPFLVVVLAVSCVDAKTALVLGGGGAKGGWTLGILEAICAGNASVSADWELVVGASIGAMTAGGLAQFNATVEDQCAGVKLIGEFWRSLKRTDVFKSTRKPLWGDEPIDCFSVVNAPWIASSLYSNGGACDPAPGYKHYKARVDADRLRSSTMELQVVTSSIELGDPVWFNNTHPHIMDAIIASGAIAPGVFPAQVPYNTSGAPWFMDGGLFHNLPILKALERGATRVIAIALSPLDTNGPGLEDFATAPNRGKSIVKFLQGVVTSTIFYKVELREACYFYPHAEILAYIPEKLIGDTLDFDPKKIDEFAKHGSEHASTTDPVDLCAALDYPRGPPPPAPCVECPQCPSCPPCPKWPGCTPCASSSLSSSSTSHFPDHHSTNHHTSASSSSASHTAAAASESESSGGSHTTVLLLVVAFVAFVGGVCLGGFGARVFVKRAASPYEVPLPAYQPPRVV
eukprot:gnl/Spiro4/26641_TR13242_c0_g1_i1.p1 gnl/Spiro4/26641_TR13242_c0_g1~~gnl/Spiro4/26641_TR13242_c0_g1_i1.p1  ORF type:complete len:482 (+),score=116.48 gnl/Spiro4/26641_TR13242_c0_g1_i1:55-1446(+)